MSVWCSLSLFTVGIDDIRMCLVPPDFICGRVRRKTRRRAARAATGVPDSGLNRREPRSHDMISAF